MANIDINAQHSMSREQAQEAADRLSQSLADKFGIEYGWDQDVIHFERPGVYGQIEVSETIIHIQAQLGFMLTLLQGPIEQEINRHLREHFGCQV